MVYLNFPVIIFPNEGKGYIKRKKTIQMLKKNIF